MNNNGTHHLHKTTHELIEDVKKKDRRFRTAQAVFMAVVVVTLAGIALAQYRTLESVQQQLAEQKILSENIKSVSDDIKKDNEAQLSKLNRRLDCIVAYFAQENREALVIQDIDACVLAGVGDGHNFFQNGDSQENNQQSQPSSESNNNGQGQQNRPPQPERPEEPTPPNDRNIFQRVIDWIGNLI